MNLLEKYQELHRTLEIIYEELSVFKGIEEIDRIAKIARDTLADVRKD